MSSEVSALSHLKQRVDIETRERDRACQEDAQAIERKAAASGMLASGNTVAQLCRLAVDDLRIRATLFAQALDETWHSFVPAPAAIAEAKHLLLAALNQAADARVQGLHESAPARSSGGIPGPSWERFRADCAEETRRFELKLTEWVLRQQQRAADQNSSQTTNVSFTGDNNVVVAGLMNSTANLHLDQSSAERLLQALAAIRAAIETTKALQPQDARDTLELVSDATHQLERPQPNKKKLAASLQGIATTIQTVGALSEAYGVLKNAMALVGLPLP